MGYMKVHAKNDRTTPLLFMICMQDSSVTHCAQHDDFGRKGVDRKQFCPQFRFSIFTLL